MARFRYRIMVPKLRKSNPRLYDVANLIFELACGIEEVHTRSSYKTYNIVISDIDIVALSMKCPDWRDCIVYYGP